MSKSSHGATPLSISELVDAAVDFIVRPDRGPALDRLFSLIHAADRDALQTEVRSHLWLRWPEDWRILDSCKRQIDQQLSGNEFWPFGTAKIRAQLAYLAPALAYFDVRGAEVMELGAGVFSPHVLSAYYYLNGAKACFAYDPSPIENKENAARALMTLLTEAVLYPDRWDLGLIARADFLARISNFDCDALDRGDLDLGCKTAPIKVFNGDPAALLRECRVDYLFSASVLEHVYELPQFLIGLRQVLKPDAVMAHVVDFTDHGYHAGTCDHRWGYLTYGGGDGGGINRVRLSGMLRMLESHGFETLHLKRYTERVPGEVLDRLLPEYRELSSEDLETYLAVIVSRRI
jgi:Methyltransferase domain